METGSFSLRSLPFFDRLAGARRVLIAGAGGGFDVFAGVPLYAALRAQQKEVFLANLSFTYLGGTDAKIVTLGLQEVRSTTRGEERYFPELRLAQWLASRGEDDRVFAFEKMGVTPMRRAYDVLVRQLDVDAIVLIDGGTDILMRGDEAGLGTPEEDMTSLAAVAQLDVPTRLLACLGFGIDAYHGVCHAHFLENVASLTSAGAFLGAFSVLPTMPEGAAFLEAIDFAQARTPSRPSIVNGSIAAALRGGFGDVPLNDRTAGSELFINPLMTLYFTFDLPGVAAHNLYLPLLEGTSSIFEVSARIEGFRHGVKARPWRAIPH
jgi:hypothetical protein